MDAVIAYILGILTIIIILLIFYEGNLVNANISTSYQTLFCSNFYVGPTGSTGSTGSGNNNNNNNNNNS